LRKGLQLYTMNFYAIVFRVLLKLTLTLLMFVNEKINISEETLFN